MTEQEQKDLDVMKESIQKEKLNFYDYMRELSRMDARELETCGFRGKTPAEAVYATFLRTQQRIEKLNKDYVKKYPD